MRYFLKNSVLACLFSAGVFAAEVVVSAPASKSAPELTAQEKAAQEKAAQEKAAQEKAAQKKAAQEQAAQEKAAQEQAAQEQAAQKKAAQERAAQEQADSDIALRITALKPGDVALTVGDMSMTWAELRPMVQPIIEDFMSQRSQRFVRRNKKSLSQEVRNTLVSLASRGIYLQHVNDLKIVLTDADRKRLEENLAQHLMVSGGIETIEKYKARMAKDKSTLARVTFEDSMRLVLWTETLVKETPIPQQEIARVMKQRANYNFLVEKQNSLLKSSITAFAAREHEKLATDEGFFELAKKCSEGLEKENGGVLDADFTRENLCRINGVKEFPYKAGETTPVFEVRECLRIMRVLSVKPPTKEGEVETLRVAQILAPKYETLPIDSKSVEVELTPTWQRFLLKMQADELAKKYPVSTPLFPDGLLPEKALSEKKGESPLSESEQK